MPSTLGVVASGEDVLNDAVLWLDASRSVAGENTMVNYGKGGSALNAQYGSTGGSDTNDPLLLTHTGTNYLYLPGIASNYASAPDSAALDITGDIEVVMRVAMDDWTPTAIQTLACKHDAGSQRSWLFEVNLTSGALRFRNSTTGASGTEITYTSSASPVVSDGAALWVKVTLDVDNGAAGKTCTFYTAADQATEPSSWTQLGTPQTSAGTTSVFAGTAQVGIGCIANGATNPLSGKVYRTIVRNGIDGTTVFDANFTTGITSGGQATFTESSANAATVTINRATSGRKSVAVVRPVLLFGTDDYLEVADNDLLDFGGTEPFTVLAVARHWATFAANATMLAKKTANGAVGVGWALRNGQGTPSQTFFEGYDGTTAVTAQAGAVKTSGAGVAFVGVASSSQLTAYSDNTAGTALTRPANTLANSEVFRVGRLSGAGAAYGDMELLAVAIWRRALNANEIATVVARYA
jgi:hypothetical protein